jgi:hypothetical protein
MYLHTTNIFSFMAWSLIKGNISFTFTVSLFPNGRSDFDRITGNRNAAAPVARTIETGAQWGQPLGGRIQK